MQLQVSLRDISLIALALAHASLASALPSADDSLSLHARLPQDEQSGMPCKSLADCAANPTLYCSPATKLCTLKSGPQGPCENNDACFEGTCQVNGTAPGSPSATNAIGFCNGAPAGTACFGPVFCADPLVCRFQDNGDGIAPTRKCAMPIPMHFGARCLPGGNAAGSLECISGLQCSLSDGIDTVCGFAPNCVTNSQVCTRDSPIHGNCCRGRCEYDNEAGDDYCFANIPSPISAFDFNGQ